MSTTLRIKDGEWDGLHKPSVGVWMPSSGLFDYVIEPIKETIKAVDENLGKKLDELIISGYYGNLNNLSKSEFQRVYVALEYVYERNLQQLLSISEADLRLEKTPAQFSNESYFSELKALFRLDDRIEGNWYIDKQIVISKQLSCTIPFWAYDLLLEMVGTNYLIILDYHETAIQLLELRSAEVMCDLTSLENRTFCAIVAVLEWLRQYHFIDSEGGRIAASPVYNREMLRVITSLCEMLRRDDRISSCQ